MLAVEIFLNGFACLVQCHLSCQPASQNEEWMNNAVTKTKDLFIHKHIMPTDPLEGKDEGRKANRQTYRQTERLSSVKKEREGAIEAGK